jgi:hypothetical protein
MKQMLMVVAILAMIVAGLATPAIAEEVQNPPNDPPPVEEEPHKDPGIRQCDLTPTPCQDTEEEATAKPYIDPGIRQCDLTPTPCENTDDSSNEHGHNSVADPDADDTKPVEEESKEEEKEDKDEENEASAPGGVKTEEVPGEIITTAQEKNDASAAPTEAVSAPNEAGQTASSGTIYGCAYDDYYYDEETDMCLPIGGPFAVLTGDKPWPESAGGYVGLLGDFVEDPLTGLGLGLQLGLGYVGDALVEFGDTGNFVGWPFQGLGYAIGFAGDVAGTLGVGVGEAVGAVSDGVGEVVDAIGDAAGAAWDEVSSWW